VKARQEAGGRRQEGNNYGIKTGFGIILFSRNKNKKKPEIQNQTFNRRTKRFKGKQDKDLSQMNPQKIDN